MGEPRPLDVLATQIREAWQELLGARMDWARSPNAETIRTAMYAEARLNRLLERLHDTMPTDKQQAVKVRGVRYSVDA